MRTTAYGAIAALLLSTLVYAAAEGPATIAEAAMAGDAEGVRRLLKTGGDVNGAQGDGMTALHWAAMHGDAALAETLLYAGANPRLDIVQALRLQFDQVELEPMYSLLHYGPQDAHPQRADSPEIDHPDDFPAPASRIGDLHRQARPMIELPGRRR